MSATEYMTTIGDPSKIVRRAIDDHLSAIMQLSQQENILNSIAKRMIGAILSGRKVLWCGNGGSAADCQHLAAEFVGRFQRDRRGYASVALTTDTSVITAIGNDYGFGEIFRRQVEAICNSGDVIVGISTSGNSKNVLAALIEAKKIGAFTVSFTGIDGGEIAAVSHAALRVASKITARIQEAHILAGHILCDWVEQVVCSTDTRAYGDQK